MKRGIPCALTLGIALLIAWPTVAQEAAKEPVHNRPKVPGTLRLHVRERKESSPGSKQFKVVERTVANAETSERICVLDRNTEPCAENLGKAGCA